MCNITQLIDAVSQGDDPTAAAQLLPLVYAELRTLAAAKLAHEKPGQTLQATALVHEAYLRVVGGNDAERWNGRGHFFAAAAEAMRRILVEAARRKACVKRGGGARRCDADLTNLVGDQPCEEVLSLNVALDELARQQPEKAELIKLRYFGGLTSAEAAEVLKISTATADRYWRYARAWLAQYIRENP
jgi:RNA polymerase sigma factor (TIGR02999 family)